MIIQLIYRIFIFLTIFASISINAQNKISVKKTHPTFDAIYKSVGEKQKASQYYCFKKSGYVYFFNSTVKDKKIIRNCKEQNWLQTNASQGKYLNRQDSIIISPISYTPLGKETSNNFFYTAVLDSIFLDVSSVGKEGKRKFVLIYPIKDITNKNK